LPFFHVRSLQVFHHQLTFLQGGTLIFYNQETFSEKSIRLPDPQNLIGVRILGGQLYILRPDSLDIYALP
ncbi:MAG: hypothetical protein ACYCOO_08950, partial [Chitinophagaceae bacterium]